MGHSWSRGLMQMNDYDENNSNGSTTTTTKSDDNKDDDNNNEGWRRGKETVPLKQVFEAPDRQQIEIVSGIWWKLGKIFNNENWARLFTMKIGQDFFTMQICTRLSCNEDWETFCLLKLDRLNANSWNSILTEFWISRNLSVSQIDWCCCWWWWWWR